MNHDLDARNLLCPMPVIKVQNLVLSVDPGDIIDVRCTDPGARSDIPTWCQINGHEILGIEEHGYEITISIRTNVESTGNLDQG